MEIYLLRDGKEVGPYSADDIRAWLKDGQVSAEELVWTEGLTEWQPLQNLLEPDLDAAAAPHQQAPEPEPEPEPVGPPASAKQKAFLTYMGTSFSPKLREAEAERLTQEVTHNRKNAKRLSKWEEDRLDLHPEMFVPEIQARMKNRPNYFFRMVETEGADCFSGVTKAHCQVLVGYLDVNHPHWDAKQADATWKFFFPAIAEKFPQLVKKEWRSKLKFKESGKVAPDPAELRSSGKSKYRRPSSMGRNLAATVTFLVMLFILGGAAFIWVFPEELSQERQQQIAGLKASLESFISGDPAPPKLKAPASNEVASPGKPAAGAPANAAPTKGAPKTVAGSAPANGAAAAAPAIPAPPGPAASGLATATPAPAVSVAPTPLPRPTEALFNPHVFATPPPAVIGDTGKSVTITQPVTLQTTYGKITIAAGTSVKVVAFDGETTRVTYMNAVVSVPTASTDAAPAR